MAELLSSAQMRAIEARAIASGAVSGRTLMERAGRGATAEILAHWPELAARAHAAVVLCGPGNNGGDGFVIARRLRDRGWAVEVLFWGDPARQPADARANHDLWCEIGTVTPLTLEAAQTGRRPALVVDALFGTGLSRAIPLDCAKAVTAIKARDEGPEDRTAMPCYVVALDCPSGLDCDSGAVLLPEIPAETRASDAAEAVAQWQRAETAQRAFAVDLTVTFHRAKLGHYLDRGCHPLRIVDIGLGADAGAPAHPASPRAADSVRLLARAGPGGPNPWPAAALSKREDAHKYAHGHALVLAGGPARSGAARLAAKAALRVGAGAVTLGAPGAAMVENAAQLNAVMLETIDAAADLTAFLAARRINAVCAGPALGLGARATGLIAALLETGLPALLDADAITLIARDTALQQALHARVVLTPHAAEFRRLCPDLAERLDHVPSTGPAFSKLDATRAAAQRLGCVCLFKGPDTVIAEPAGPASINAATGARAAPWLATAGSGDVLAGLITGLLARGQTPMAAAEIAAWLHVEAGRAIGPGLIAEDLPDALPGLFKTLGV